ncbi:F-box/WD repeat-containing protein 7 [Plakobranchus ocellatus]|uniref:Transportin-3 n=1 Tax=Plakobranchus ocellatus TaxID=259542 RepID=A0AAV4CKF0_9GAST|nr:F-box/WD repeat-containing protein 7 [Plakobranchus ocellatus]
MATLILDNGAGTAKVGFSTDTEPRIIPNCVTKAKNVRTRIFIGDQIDECKDLSSLYYLLPFQKGFLVNWEIEKQVWDHIFSKDVCQVDFNETTVMVTEPFFNFPSVGEAINEVIFEEYQFQSLHRTQAATLSCYKHQKDKETSGSLFGTLVVESGYSFSHLVPFLKNKPLKEAIVRVNVGGKVLTNHLKEVISYRQLMVMDETYVINQMKEDVCYVSTQFSKDMGIARVTRFGLLWLLYTACHQKGDLRLLGPPTGQCAGGGALTCNRRVPADLKCRFAIQCVTNVFAWQIADQLLRLNQSLESCYFAAQTMRTKSLRDSLIEHASKIAPGTPPVIVTQLSLALADLALQMATWKSAVLDLIEKFNKDHTGFLLELLTVLPEEIGSSSLRLGANRRKEITDELIAASPMVIHMLTHLNTTMSGNEEREQRARSKTYKVMGSWFSVSAIPQQVLLSTQLMNYPFQAMADIHCPAFLHEAATDCICSALYSAEDLEQYGELAKRLFQGVMTLVPAYHQADKDEESDKCLNYCRVFTELSESLFDMLLATPNEVCEITFNFWYRLSEELYQRNNQELTDLFKPYVQSLVLALCQHCQMDEDHEGIPDENSEFGEFRVRVSELIKDVVFIAGSSSCFVQMFESLKAPSNPSWSVSESALFIMSSVAKNILPEENEIVPQVLQAILAMPDSTHIAVRHTGIQLLGELAEWIDNHGQLLDPILQTLLAGLQQPALASVSANALQNLCTQCRGQMINHFDGLMQIVKAMDTFNVSPDASIGLLKGTAIILGRLDNHNITEALSQLCACQIAPLEKLLQEESGPVKHGSANDPTMWLDRLAAVFRYTSPNITNGQAHPCQPVIVEVWPVLSRACEKYQADVKIIERCCRCIRFAIRCLGKNSAILLTPLVTQMVSLYQTHQHSCFLYLGSILVDEYGTESGCVPGLLDMLQAFCGPTFKILEEHNGLRNHPDSVDDLFRLCLRFIQRAPVPFLQSAMAKPIMCCAIAACSLDHKDANGSVVKFLTDLIQCARERQNKEDFEQRSALVRKLLSEHGQNLMIALINACLFCLPTFMVSDISDVMWELKLTDAQVRKAMTKYFVTSLNEFHCYK